jgi:hypothetical protein
VLGPLARFNQTIDRCYRLVDHYKEQSRIGRPGQHLADVLRGTVVLTCAALDALNEELLVRALPQAQRRGLLGGAAPTMRASRALVNDLRRPAGPPLGTRARDHLRWMTVQRPEMIEELVVNVLGADLPWRTAAVELTRDSRRAWTDAEVRTRLGVLVERRNAIAHRGDLRPSGRSESIRRANVEADILLAYEVGHAIRDVIRQRL